MSVDVPSESEDLDFDALLSNFKKSFLTGNDSDNIVPTSNDVGGGYVTTNDFHVTVEAESNDVDAVESPPVEIVEPAPVEVSCPPAEECIVRDGCLTSIDDVRRFVLDRMLDDNEIDLELFFTDVEIVTARRLAVAFYNEIPPYVENISLTSCNEDCLPAPIMFLNGIAHQLYLAKLQKLQKEDVDYQAGGMTVNIIKKRIAYITSNIKGFKDEFQNLAVSRKTHINYSSAFGRVG